MSAARDVAGDLREGEVALKSAPRRDAWVGFVGRIETPWATRDLCPRQGDRDAGPVCRLVFDPCWEPALDARSGLPFSPCGRRACPGLDPGCPKGG